MTIKERLQKTAGMQIELNENMSGAEGGTISSPKEFLELLNTLKAAVKGNTVTPQLKAEYAKFNSAKREFANLVAQNAQAVGAIDNLFKTGTQAGGEEFGGKKKVYSKKTKNEGDDIEPMNSKKKA